MSRIGKLPIDVPTTVELTITPSTEGAHIKVKGPLGELEQTFRPEMTFEQDGPVVTVIRKDETKLSRSLHGLSRTLLNNMILGVSQGFEKNMEIVGVGYRAAVEGKKLNLTLGFSHPIHLDIPESLTVKVDGNTKLSVKGIHPQHVGDLCAKIRSFRPPEPYKGKGIKFAGEKIRRKAGKAGK